MYKKFQIQKNPFLTNNCKQYWAGLDRIGQQKGIMLYVERHANVSQ